MYRPTNENLNKLLYYYGNNQVQNKKIPIRTLCQAQTAENPQRVLFPFHSKKNIAEQLI